MKSKLLFLLLSAHLSTYVQNPYISTAVLLAYYPFNANDVNLNGYNVLITGSYSTSNDYLNNDCSFI